MIIRNKILLYLIIMLLDIPIAIYTQSLPLSLIMMGLLLYVTYLTYKFVTD